MYAMKTRIIHTKIWEDSWFAQLSRVSKLVFLFLLTSKENNLASVYEMPDRVIQFNTQVTSSELEQAKLDLEGKIKFFDSWVKIVNADLYNNYRFSKRNEKAYNRELELIPEHVREVFGLKFTMEEFQKKTYKKNNGQYVHRRIATKLLGRELKKNEVVHHIDEDPENNDPSNLAVMTDSEHRQLHAGKIKLEDTSMILVSNKKILVRNQKSETINHKSKIINHKSEKERKVLEKFNGVLSKNFTSTKSWSSNFENWLKEFSLEDILKSIENIPKHKWLRDKNVTPTMFFRTDKDWIEQCLNLPKTTHNGIYDGGGSTLAIN